MTNTTRRWSAVAAVAALVALSGCSSAAGKQTGQPVAPDVSTAVVGFGDDLNHFALATTPAPADAAPVSDVADSAASGAGSLSVTHTDGSVEQRPEVADGSLTAVVAETPAERALLDTNTNAVIVFDADGVLGMAGTRYLHSEAGMLELDTQSETAPLNDVAVAGDESIADALRAVEGVETVTVVGPGIIQVATSGDAESLLAVPGVESAQDEVLFGLFTDTRQGEQWAIGNTGSPAQALGWPGVAEADISVLEAWNVTTGTGVVVAVIDTGVQLNHPDLAANMWSNSDQACGAADTDGNGFAGDCNGWDFGSNDADVRPDASWVDSFHGTHVAGIVAAARNGAGVAGVAPGATVMALKVSDATGVIPWSGLVAAIDYAVANGADVINLSLGTKPGANAYAQMGFFEAAIARAKAAGVLVVTAMGNDSADITSAPVWPASYSLYHDNVIAVGASTNSDTKASFSNTGTPLGLYAPGWAILSTMPGNTWDFKFGTSMAAPMVAGGAALMIASGQVTAPAAVRDRLISTATPIGVGGRLNMAAALGVQADTGVRVTFNGADTLTPDAPGQLGFNIRAVDVGAAAKLRISVGANSAGAVHAVEGLTASFADANGQLASATTGPDGSFEVMTLRTVASLATTGSDFTAQLTLPAGEFAIVTELLDASNNPVGGAQAAYLSVSAAGSTVTTTSTAAGVPPTTAVGGGVTPTTAPRAPVTTTTPTTTPGTPTTVAATAPTTVATTSPGTPTTTATTPVTPTTAPTATSPTTTKPATPTTAPTTATTVAAAPTTTTPVVTPPATTVAPGPTTSVAPTTTVAGATTTTIASGSTTPQRDPDADGVWKLDEMFPRIAGVTGGTPLVLYGNFPTNVPVYVWFGPLAIVQAASFGSRLTLNSPAVPYGAVTDVVVMFATSRTFELNLDGDFTFDGPTAPVTTTTVSSPGTATTVPAIPPATTPTTVPGVTTTTRPTATTPPTVTTQPTQPTVPTTPSPPPVTTQPPVTTTTIFVAAQTGVLGQLTLRQVSARSALVQLNVAVWPKPGCRTAMCSSVTL
jgi:subtilisin family serine protease